MKAYRKAQGLVLLSILAGVGANAAWAQNYPTRPVRIQTAGAGGGADTTSRLVAAELSGPLGQQVIVENRPAGVPLVLGVRNAAPDGYTLLVIGGTLWTAQLFDDVPYDPIRDLAPVANLVRTPNLLAVHPSLPVQSVAEMIKYAKSKPGELNYSTGSTGSASHISGALFAAMVGVEMVRISYKDQSNETNDLMSGRVQFTVQSAPSLNPLLKAGKMRALGVASARRSPQYPDLPTIAESLPGYESDQSTVLMAPAKTPEAIVRRLNAETVRFLEKPDVKERLLRNSQEAVGGTPEQLTEYMKADLARLSKIFKKPS